MKKMLLTLFVLANINGVFSQKVPKGAIITEALQEFRNITVSFEQQRNTAYQIILYNHLLIETDYNQFNALSDSAGNKITFRTPTQAIGFFEERGWELRFVNTSPMAELQSDPVIHEKISRLSLFFTRKKHL